MFYANKYGIFIVFSLFFQVQYLMEKKAQQLWFLKELKSNLETHKKKAQIWTDPKHILHLLEDPAGYTRHNKMVENSLAQRPRFCRENAALTADPRQSYGHWSSSWSNGCGGMASSPESYK